MKKKAAFIGSGMIGSGLAVNAMMHGYETWLQTRSQVDKVKGRVAHIFDVMVENGICTREEADGYAKLATYTTSVEDAVAGAAFIQESGPENLETKKGLLAQIEATCDADAIIASSTSQLLPSDLQEGALHPERILVGHPYHPSYLLPLVELCGGKQTAQWCIDRAVCFYEEIGKVALVCKKEVSGYIVNRLSWAALNEARKTVWDGCCSVEDMDKAIMYGPGLRMAITGQILSVSLGVEGGVRAQLAKYGKEPTPQMEIIASGVDEEIANRPEGIGNTVDAIGDFRDKAIVEILRLQNML